MGAGRQAAPPHPFQTALTPPGLETPDLLKIALYSCCSTRSDCFQRVHRLPHGFLLLLWCGASTVGSLWAVSCPDRLMGEAPGRSEGATMPRFYLDILNGSQVLEDPDGQAFADLDAAMSEAV